MTDILITKKNIIIDATVFSTLMGCARLTDFRFNHNLKSVKGKSRSLEMGSIVHAVFECYYKNIINGFSRELSIQSGLIAGQEYIKSGEVQNTEPNQIQWALSTCEQYFDFYKNDSWTPIFVNEVKGKVLYEDDEIRILWKSQIDLAVDTNQGIYPVDHKSMSANRDTISLNNQFIGQCHVMETHNTIIDKVGFQTSLKPVDKFIRKIVSYSAERLLEWQSEILPYYCKLMLMYAESEYWPPDWTHCETKYGKCQFIDICESNPNMREEELRLNFIVGDKWDPENE